ncbi:MAG: prepilin peptidase [Spirochaetia bacterium]|nr:prepilin peptidase [Spirochaetia bacterium]
MAFFTGLLLGSFYTALADRILYYFYGPGRKGSGKWEKIFMKSSFCFSCGQNIKTLDLIPVLGYILLKGRCRNCLAPIGWIRLTGEIFPGIILMIFVLLNSNWAYSFFSILLIGHLYISLVTDWNFFLLDYENTAFLYVWGFLAVYTEYGYSTELLHHFYTAGFVFFVLLVLFLAGKGKKFGMGDLILAPSLALYLGPLLSILFFQLAASLSIVYIVIIQKNRKAPSPFGTFMAVSFFIIVSFDLFYKVFIQFIRN